MAGLAVLPSCITINLAPPATDTIKSTITPIPTDTPVPSITPTPKPSLEVTQPSIEETQPSIPLFWLYRIEEYCKYKYDKGSAEGGIKLSEWYYIALCTNNMEEKFLEDPNNTKKEIMDALK